MNTRLEEAKSKMFSKGFLDFESPEKIDYVKEIEILKKRVEILEKKSATSSQNRTKKKSKKVKKS